MKKCQPAACFILEDILEKYGKMHKKNEINKKN